MSFNSGIYSAGKMMDTPSHAVFFIFTTFNSEDGHKRHEKCGMKPTVMRVKSKTFNS